MGDTTAYSVYFLAQAKGSHDNVDIYDYVISVKHICPVKSGNFDPWLM